VTATVVEVEVKRKGDGDYGIESDLIDKYLSSSGNGRKCK
jgi:hypothetical protein